MDLHLSNASIEENQPAGTVVGHLQVVDPEDLDGNGQYTFSLVSGEGDEANEDFIVDENGTLRTVGPFDYEDEEVDGNATLPIRVRVADEDEASFEKVLAISVLDQFQSITNFGGDFSAHYGDEPVELNATATSGLPVQYLSSNSEVAEVDTDGTVSFKGTGQATITALQDGGGFSDAAPELNATVTPPITNRFLGKTLFTWWAGSMGVSVYPSQLGSKNILVRPLWSSRSRVARKRQQRVLPSGPLLTTEGSSTE